MNVPESKLNDFVNNVEHFISKKYEPPIDKECSTKLFMIANNIIICSPTLETQVNEFLDIVKEKFSKKYNPPIDKQNATKLFMMANKIIKKKPKPIIKPLSTRHFITKLDDNFKNFFKKFREEIFNETNVDVNTYVSRPLIMQEIMLYIKTKKLNKDDDDKTIPNYKYDKELFDLLNLNENDNLTFYNIQSKISKCCKAPTEDDYEEMNMNY